MINGGILDKKAKEIEEIIYGFLPKAGVHDGRIVEAANYSVTAGGKRLRPMLMQETFKMFYGADAENASDENVKMLHRFMSAIEFIHTYSLVHDDLPAMDNDELRRGKPTTHAKYGEAFGVLAGDALLNLAFETICDGMCGVDGCGSNEKTTNGQMLNAWTLANSAKALKILAKKAGIFGMIGGQCLDVYNEKNDKDNNLEQIEYIYENKTGALLEAAMMVGAVLAGADENQVKSVEQIASNVGFAFQIRDDILDITSTTEQLGKPVGSDEKNHKETYATLKGLEQAQKDVAEYSQKAEQILASLPVQNEFLKELVDFLTTRKK